MRPRTASHCVFANCVLQKAISVIHTGTFRVWMLSPLHAGHHWCVATYAERNRRRTIRLALPIRGNAPMSSNRDDFREVAYSNQLRVTIRSFLGETQYTLGVLVVEMRDHSRCRQMDHAGASSSNISRPCTLRYKSTRISMPLAASLPK